MMLGIQYASVHGDFVHLISAHDVIQLPIANEQETAESWQAILGGVATLCNGLAAVIDQGQCKSKGSSCARA